jgi:hypothetical protein
MTEDYKTALLESITAICDYAPQSATILELIQRTCGTKTAFYAAFIITWMRAQRELFGLQKLEAITLDQVQSFTFFEYARDNQEALTLFHELFLRFKQEQTSADSPMN